LPESFDILTYAVRSDGQPNSTTQGDSLPMARGDFLISCGLLPYLGGLLVTLTRQIGWLVFAGAVICVISTSAAYVLRKSTDPVTAKQRLMIDPLLYGFEFAFTAVLIRYVFIR
jgi:hypothetical protein